MLLRHKYLTLKYVNMAPCIIRRDKVKDIREMPGGRTEITCSDGRVCLVRETIDEVTERLKKTKGKKNGQI